MVKSIGSPPTGSGTAAARRTFSSPRTPNDRAGAQPGTLGRISKFSKNSFRTLEWHGGWSSPTSSRGIPVDGEVLRRLIREAGGGVRVRVLSGRTGTATAMRGGLAVVTYPDGVERVDPAWLAWAGKPMGSTSREDDL